MAEALHIQAFPGSAHLVPSLDTPLALSTPLVLRNPKLKHLSNPPPKIPRRELRQSHGEGGKRLADI